MKNSTLRDNGEVRPPAISHIGLCHPNQSCHLCATDQQAGPVVAFDPSKKGGSKLISSPLKLFSRLLESIPMQKSSLGINPKTVRINFNLELLTNQNLISYHTLPGGYQARGQMCQEGAPHRANATLGEHRGQGHPPTRGFWEQVANVGSQGVSETKAAPAPAKETLGPPPGVGQ